MADKEFLLKAKEAEQIYLRKDEYDYIKYQEAVLTASSWDPASKNANNYLQWNISRCNKTINYNYS